VEEEIQPKTESQGGTRPEKKDPEGSPVSFIQKAEALRGEGRIEEAIGICREGLAKTPGVLAARLLLGRCYFEKGMMEQAKEELEKVAQEIEECLPVFRLLSQIYLEAKEVDKALEVMRKTMYFTAPSAPEAKKTTPLEMGLLHRGKYPPFSVPPLAEQERRAQGEGKAEEGEGEKKREAQAFQTDTLAEIYVKQGQLEKALAIYRDILKREPENVQMQAKFEALKKEMGMDRRAAGKKVKGQLERWLAIVETRKHSDMGG
jgi:tetratricopeptide (TPR) repeat protein